MKSRTKLLLSSILTLALGLTLTKAVLAKRYPAQEISARAAAIAISIDGCEAPDLPDC